MKYPILGILLVLSSSYLFAQTKSSNILWDKDENKPIPYATIKSEEDYSISNEEGGFELEKTSGKIKIQSVIYETLEIDFDFLKANDTICIKPITYK